jgi:hypothetical protein
VGVTADVNGDTAIGIKNDPMNNDSTGLWTDDGVNITLAFVAAEYSVTTDAATQRAWIVAAALTAHKLYKIELDIKDGTAASRQIEGYFNDGAAQYGAIKTTAAGWVSVSWTFECATTTAAGLVGFRIPVSLGGLNIQIRRFSCYEITPCCTAADTLGWDGWVKDTTLDIYREHAGTNTFNGMFYSLKMVPSSANDFVYWPKGFYNLEEWYQQFRGRTVTIACMAKTSTANHFRLAISDGVGTTYSSYHTGGGAAEWITVTRTIDAAATEFRVLFYGDIAGNVNGNTIIYAGLDIAVLGSSIGAGNYRPRQQEFIQLEKIILSNLYSPLLGLNSGAIAINLEADTDGKLPKGAKAVHLYLVSRDSGSAAASDIYFAFRKNTSTDYCFAQSLSGKTNDIYCIKTGLAFCDVNGDIIGYVNASGVGTFDSDSFFYLGIQVN